MKLIKSLFLFPLVLGAATVPTFLTLQHNSSATASYASQIKATSNEYTPITSFLYYIDETNKTIRIDGFNPFINHPTNINIAPTYDITHQTYTVTGIGENAFYRSDLRNVILPSTIETIGDFAFAQQNVTSLRDDTPENDKDARVVNFDLSQCNNLNKLGDYCFHGCTTGEFLLPTDNHVLSHLGNDAFTSIKFFSDLNFSGFKNVDDIGEWEFYGCQNGSISNNSSHSKIILPSNMVNATSSVFTNSDVQYVYWNVLKANWDTDCATKGSDYFAPGGITFFLTNLKELHVQQGANLQQWANDIANNGFHVFYVEKLIADIQPDGTVGTPTDEIDNIGVPFTENDVANAVKTILSWKIPFTNYFIYDIANLLPIVDEILTLASNPIMEKLIDYYYPSMNIDWNAHMYQCELFCLWDRYFRFDNPR